METLRILNYVTRTPPPAAPSRAALCSVVLAVSVKALFISFSPSNAYRRAPSATAHVCVCVRVDCDTGVKFVSVPFLPVG